MNTKTAMSDKSQQPAAEPQPGPTTSRARVELQFMVVPELLSSLAYVPNPIRCHRRSNETAEKLLCVTSN